MSRRKDNMGVSSLKKYNITLCVTQHKPDILNDQFSSVFTNDYLSDRPSLHDSTTPSMDPITVTVKGVHISCAKT